MLDDKQIIEIFTNIYQTLWSKRNDHFFHRNVESMFKCFFLQKYCQRFMDLNLRARNRSMVSKIKFNIDISLDRMNINSVLIYTTSGSESLIRLAERLNTIAGSTVHMYSDSSYIVDSTSHYNEIMDYKSNPITTLDSIKLSINNIANIKF